MRNVKQKSGKVQKLLKVKFTPQTWPVAGSFRIAHGSLSAIETVSTEIIYSLPSLNVPHKTIHAKSECRPYARYDETVSSVVTALEERLPKIQEITTIGLGGFADRQVPSKTALLQMIKACTALFEHGAAQNLINCALWDLVAKILGQPAWALIGLAAPRPRQTAFTLSIDNPKNMALAAIKASDYPILKLKIAELEGLKSCLAVLEARPDAQLIIDANESLRPDQLPEFQRALAGKQVLMIEQPIKAGLDLKLPIDPNTSPPICADESLHSINDLIPLWQAGYRAVNVKLDKAGGFGPAHALMHQAHDMGFQIMAGCMVGTSLAMAPMMCLESLAHVIDLDGPLLLAKDVENGLHYDKAIVHPPKPDLWG